MFGIKIFPGTEGSNQQGEARAATALALQEAGESLPAPGAEFSF